MEVITAQYGFCIGINRAYRGLAKRAGETPGLHVTHQNSGGAFDTLRRIERREPELLQAYPALSTVSVAYDTGKLDAGADLAIGFHGLTPATKAELTERGVRVVEDFICPFIAKLDRVVERVASQGYDIAIVGQDDNHHCRTAEAFAKQYGRAYYLIRTPDELAAVPSDGDEPLALVGQVTGNTVIFAKVIERIKSFSRPVRVLKTMCADSYTRQRMAADLAREADVVLLVDDGGGGALSVHEVCTAAGARIHRIRSKDDIKPEWLASAGTVAVLGGILVPEWSIADVAGHVRGMSP